MNRKHLAYIISYSSTIDIFVALVWPFPKHPTFRRVKFRAAKDITVHVTHTKPHQKNLTISQILQRFFLLVVQDPGHWSVHLRSPPQNTCQTWMQSKTPKLFWHAFFSSLFCGSLVEGSTFQINGTTNPENRASNVAGFSLRLTSVVGVTEKLKFD